MQFRKGYTYDEIAVGDAGSFAKTITESDIHAFSAITGDFNAAHVDEQYMQTSALGQKMKGRIAQGMLTAGLFFRRWSASAFPARARSMFRKPATSNCR